MSKIILTGALKDLAGVTEIDLEVATIGQLVATLGERYPALKPRLKRGLTVAIDGNVYRGAWMQPIPPGSNVHLIQAMPGG